VPNPNPGGVAGQSPNDGMGIAGYVTSCRTGDELSIELTIAVHHFRPQEANVQQTLRDLNTAQNPP